MNDFAIVPYCKVDGVRTFPDSKIMALYDRAVADGTAKTVFMGSDIKSAKSFLSAMKSSGVFFYILYVDGEEAGMVWLNRLQYRWAQFHFCTFKPVWGKTTIALGRHVLRKLLTMADNQGRYFFDMFVGIMPTANRVAVAYVQKCGGVVSGNLPYGVFNDETGQSEEATIITLTREGLQ